MRLAFTAASLTALPAAALAAPLTPALVFVDSAPFPKAIMLGLIGATAAAIIICARKLMAGPHLAGGSAFVSGARLGGPLAGALGASYTMLMGFMGIANVDYPVTLKIIAPGLAEATFLLGLGLLAGAVAVAGHWALEARIDRDVLEG